MHPLLDVESIGIPPRRYLHDTGGVFAVFDAQTQDSGNISYGVRIGDDQYFTKTAENPGHAKPYFTHSQRVDCLHNAVKLARSCDYTALPLLYQVIWSPNGPVLVYAWVEGELLNSPRDKRTDPHSAFHMAWRSARNLS